MMSTPNLLVLDGGGNGANNVGGGGGGVRTGGGGMLAGNKQGLIGGGGGGKLSPIVSNATSPADSPMGADVVAAAATLTTRLCARLARRGCAVRSLL